MTRDQLARHLAVLVRRGTLTQDEANQVLAAFDAGQIAPDTLPLDAQAALAASETDRREELWLLLLLLLGIGRVASVRRLRDNQRRRVRELLAGRFEETINVIAAKSLTSIAEWQRRMAVAISDYALAQATAGAGRLLSDAQLARVQAANRRNLAFLALFALHAAAVRVLGRPMPYEAVRSRSLLYGGMGWGQFDRAAEDDALRGYISRWYAKDDKNTCPDCAALHDRTFLPGQGPFPGETCRGGARCRCERRLEYNPAEYARLSGQRP